MERLEHRRLSLEQRRASLTAPTPPADRPAPRLVLHRIDRAIGATRLPVRVWQVIAGSGVGSLAAGFFWIVVAGWWRQATAEALAWEAGPPNERA